MTPARFTAGIAVLAGALLLQGLGIVAATAIVNRNGEPWMSTWEELTEAPERLADALSYMAEMQTAPTAEQEPECITVFLRQDAPVAVLRGQELSPAELKNRLNAEHLGEEATPVVFRTGEDLTEAQWDSLLTPCLEECSHFWNYSIEAPEPEADKSTAAEPPQQPRVYVEISGFNGETIIYCGDERIDEADFPAFAEELAARTPRPQICLNGQCSLPWERMKELVEICIDKGFTRNEVILSMQCGPEPQNP